MDDRTSMFEQLVSRPRLPWLTFGIVLLLLVAPFAAAFVDGSLPEILESGNWRALIVPPVVILYILLVAPRMTQMDDRVLQTLRSVALVDDAAFDQTVSEASSIGRNAEWAAIALGCLLGLVLALGQREATPSPVSVLWSTSTVLMFGVLGWTIYVSFVGTRLTGAILRLPLRIEPLDTTPFEAIGRQSFLLALVFVGGITISLLSSVNDLGAIRDWRFWALYVPMISVPVIIFFLNMRPTHAVLAAAKNQELKAVRDQIISTGKALMEHLANEQDAAQPAQLMDALLAYEDRLKEARTWPYNTATLRTLFISVLFPIVTVAARVFTMRL